MHAGIGRIELSVANVLGIEGNGWNLSPKNPSATPGGDRPRCPTEGSEGLIPSAAGYEKCNFFVLFCALRSFLAVLLADKTASLLVFGKYLFVGYFLSELPERFFQISCYLDFCHVSLNHSPFTMKTLDMNGLYAGHQSSTMRDRALFQGAPIVSEISQKVQYLHAIGRWVATPLVPDRICGR